jgi:WD40 repeat protein
MHSQHNSSNDASLLGKGDLFQTDLTCEQERKRARPNFPEEFDSSRSDSTYHLGLPWIKDSFPLLGTTPGIIESPSAALAFLSDDIIVIPQEESKAGVSITYNNQVERSLDVSFVRSLDPKLSSIGCLKFSKDGKYLAAGFIGDGKTNIYDVQTGERTWSVFHNFSSLDKADQSLVSVR